MLNLFLSFAQYLHILDFSYVHISIMVQHFFISMPSEFLYVVVIIPLLHQKAHSTIPCPPIADLLMYGIILGFCLVLVRWFVSWTCQDFSNPEGTLAEVGIYPLFDLHLYME
jgi:hypothetical protein